MSFSLMNLQTNLSMNSDSHSKSILNQKCGFQKFANLDKNVGRKALSVLLSVSLLAGSFSASALAENSIRLTGDVHISTHAANLRETVPIAGASKNVTMSFRGVAIADALRALAKKGGFNVLVDESVEGSISVDLNNVSIHDALETVKTYGNLAYSVQDGSLMVADANSEKGQSYKKASTRIFHLKNANARVVADLLNRTLFSDRMAASGASGAGGGGASSTGGAGLPVTADSHTNNLIVMGSPTDIKSVEDHLDALDQPRQMRTWRLSQSNVLDVATLLSSSLFNEGQPVILTGGASGGGAAAGGGAAGGAQNTAMPSTLRVTAENITDNTGGSQPSQSGGSSSGSSGSGGVVNSMTLRAKVKETQTVQISPNGPILIPDTRLNTLTLLGTVEQIAMAEALIPTLDRKVPQVVLEASLVEISDLGRRELGFNSGSNSGYFSSGTNNLSSTSAALVNRAFSNLTGRETSTTSPLESIFRFSTNPTTRGREYVYQINALVNKNKAKLLANPTVVSTSDSETIISIVDEIIKSVTITVGTNSGVGSTTTATNNIGEAGIVLNILPRVGADGTVSLRVRPVVSTVASTQTDRFGNLVTLLSKREILAQNTVLRDGESFILGGLLQDTNVQAVTRNPLLSNLPIVGALARNSTNSKRRTELVIIITPHIMNDESMVARSNPSVPHSQMIPATRGASSPFAAAWESTMPSRSDTGLIPVSLQGNAPQGNPSGASSGTNAAGHRPVLPPLEKVQILGAAGANNAANNTTDDAPLALLQSANTQSIEKTPSSTMDSRQSGATPNSAQEKPAQSVWTNSYKSKRQSGKPIVTVPTSP